jgi:hypothetical protein
VKIHVAAVEALLKKERQGETFGVSPPLNANVLFLQVLKKSHPVYDQF